jgi:MraZ protein
VAGFLPLRHFGPDSSKRRPRAPGGRERQLAFRGHYDHTLDAKHRLSIPAKFRAAFSSGLVLARWLDPCITIWTPQEFEAFTESWVSDLSPLGKKRRHLTAFFAHNSFDAELDSAGRLTLNPTLLEHAGITKDVVLAGNIDHLEVWDRDRWGAHHRELSAGVVDLAESLDHPS